MNQNNSNYSEYFNNVVQKMMSGAEKLIEKLNESIADETDPNKKTVLLEELRLHEYVRDMA